MKLKKLPIGIQNIREILEEGYLYVDKTEYIYRLITGNKYIFLSRPRRFGKSLLISTIEEIFRGNRELFKGLWIYDSDYDWVEYPVIKLDMSNISMFSSDALLRSLLKQILFQERLLGLDIKDDVPQTAFDTTIKEAYLKYSRKVVILIDEYDAPIISVLDDTEKALEIRDVLRGFYRVIKANDEYIKFAMLTGVSRFSRAGVFSALNNLRDITIQPDYALMLGITQEELERYFSGYIELLAEKEGMSYEDMLEKIRFWYNGFCFDGDKPRDDRRVYNPFSTLLLFENRAFSNYWFESGTPKFLIDLIIKNKHISIW